jgi:hypothetical protein
MVETVSRAQPARLGRLAVSRWAVLVGVTFVAGVVLRVWLYRSNLGIPNSDEAVFGLMAMHAMHGEFTTFLWGQAYGGSQEALLAVPLFAVFGPSWIALRMVSFVLTAVAALVVWRVGLRTIGSRAAAVAGAAYWIWPPFLLFHLGHQYGFYASGVTYCGLILLLALQIVERPSRLRVGLLGLVLGLAFWQTPQMVPIAVPALAWMVWRRPGSLRHIWVAVPLALIGAAPWLSYNARHDWSSLSLPFADTSYIHRLRVFVSPLIGMTIGLRTPFTQELLLPRLVTYLVYVVLLVLFVVSAIKTRTRLVSLLYAVAIVFPFVYAIQPLTKVSSEPRYLLIATPVLTLLLAQLATTYARAIAALAIAAALSIVTLHRMDFTAQGGAQDPLAPPPADFRPLIATLDRVGLTRVYADYWVAYRLDFETHERIIAANNRFRSATFMNGQVTPPIDLWRYPPYAVKVAAASHGFVFLREATALNRIAPLLERHRYRRYAVGRFVVYAPPS